MGHQAGERRMSAESVEAPSPEIGAKGDSGRNCRSFEVLALLHRAAAIAHGTYRPCPAVAFPTQTRRPTD